MTNSFITFYQNLPLFLNPIAFKIGFFSVTWYALMYLVGFLTVYGLLSWRIKYEGQKYPSLSVLFKNLDNLFIYLIFGLLIGARLGYVLFYEPTFYFQNPWRIISPFGSGGELVGIYGMSYHGGLMGIIIAAIIFAKRNQLNFWVLADFVVPAIPAGYFFGRIGNFLNGELFGRMTAKPWGMYFLDENNIIALRHPSQLYEAFFEGIVLFLILWLLRNKAMSKISNFKFQISNLPPHVSCLMSHVSCLIIYILLYGFFRFFIEFFRQPDPQIGLIFNFFTLGQIFSLGMIALAFLILWFRKKQL